jgi:hypothetical protein
MAKWQRRPHFNRIVPEMMRCRDASARFMSVAANAMSGFMSIDCVETRTARISQTIVEPLVPSA